MHKISSNSPEIKNNKFITNSLGSSAAGLNFRSFPCEEAVSERPRIPWSKEVLEAYKMQKKLLA